MLQEQSFHGAVGPVVHGVRQQLHWDLIHAEEVAHKHNLKKDLRLDFIKMMKKKKTNFINFFVDGAHSGYQTYVVGDCDQRSIRKIRFAYALPSLLWVHLTEA